TLQVPAYVDSISTGAEAAFAQAKIQVCLSPPDVPTSNPNRAAFGAKLLRATLSLTGVLTNPVASGTYVWRALFTPFTPGAGVPNPAGTVESQSITPLPALLTLSGSYSKSTRKVTLRG